MEALFNAPEEFREEFSKQYSDLADKLITEAIQVGDNEQLRRLTMGVMHFAQRHDEGSWFWLAEHWIVVNILRPLCCSVIFFAKTKSQITLFDCKWLYAIPWRVLKRMRLI